MQRERDTRGSVKGEEEKDKDEIYPMLHPLGSVQVHQIVGF